ncbi:MAG: membrane protein insertase YidC [Myxococcota bacterium]|nr:membrane protein insertase YidC [Myxococcota bacterium]
MEAPERDPEQDRRILVAVVLSIGVLWIFSFFAPKPPPRPLDTESAVDVADGEFSAPQAEQLPPADAREPGDGAVAGDDDDSALSSEARVAEPVIAGPDLQESSSRWEELDVRWSNRGAGPTSVLVSDYNEPYEQQWIPTWLWDGIKGGFDWEPFVLSIDDDEPMVDIIVDGSGVLLPVGLDERGPRTDTGNYRILQDKPARGEEAGTLQYGARRGRVQVTKTFVFPETGYLFDYVVRLENTDSRAVQVTPSFGVSDRIAEATGGYYGSETETWAEVDEDVENYPAKKLDKEVREFEGSVAWFGIADRYFIVGLEPTSPVQGQVVMGPTDGEDRYLSELRLAPLTLEPGGSETYRFKLWMGPKELEALKDKNLRMRSSVDYGYFGFLAIPILWFLKLLYGFFASLGVASWGLAIIALTVCIKLALFPLSQKSYRSMKGMQKLQPEINALKEKHGEDKEALNREMMGLWKEHGVNPMGGCFPMLLQMPIWFALYRVLWNSVELYQQPFLYFVDLSLRDPLGLFPFLLGITMWAQQKFTASTVTDPTQKMVMKFMPIFFSVIMFTLPAGLVVYILVNNILSIGQQWVIHRQADEPKTDEPKTDAKGSPAGGSSGKKPPGKKKKK